MRGHMERMRTIDAHGLRITAQLAVFNAKMIFRNANGQLRHDVRVPEQAMQELEGLMMSGVSDDG